jgi:hypothetical protein
MPTEQIDRRANNLSTLFIDTAHSEPEFCLVVVCRTPNTFSRRKDTISVDFIAALLLFVGTTHVLFQITRLPASGRRDDSHEACRAAKLITYTRGTAELLRNIFDSGTTVGHVLQTLMR